MKQQQQHTYTTVNGMEVPYQALSIIELNLAETGLRQEYIERNEPIEPPKYRVDLAGGGYQEFPHDATTIRTDDEKAQWAAYEDANNRYQQERARLIQEMVFDEAILLKMPTDGAWEAKQKKRHITIPDDPEEKRMHYYKLDLSKNSFLDESVRVRGFYNQVFNVTPIPILRLVGAALYKHIG